MKSRILLSCAILSMVLCSILLLGCGTTRPTEFYLLTPLPDSGAAAPETGKNLTIGIGPLVLVDYLDRPQIVTRENDNKVLLNEFHQWAEPMKHNLLRILAMNLSILLSTDQTIPFPWKGHMPMDYRVSVDIVQFDRGPDGTITLKARWIITDEADKEAPPRIHQTTISKPAGEEDNYAALAAAMSEAFADLCRKIAAAIVP